ncbi:MAG: hypothetical protein IT204_23850 [Fimbriimonadaceae bacterium]|nr:hypothetical protein [Fimbriimonadaceae bacterium]
MRTMRMIGAGLVLVAMTSPSWAAGVDFETEASVSSSVTVNVFVQKYAEITLPSADLDLDISSTDLDDTATSAPGSVRANVPIDVTLACASSVMSLTAADGITSLDQAPGAAQGGNHYEWNALLTVGSATALLAPKAPLATLYAGTYDSTTGVLADIAPGAARDVTVEASIKADSIWNFRGMGTSTAGTANGGAVLTLTVAPSP